MERNTLLIVLFLISMCTQIVWAGDQKILRLYHDADWSNHVESAESIWRGVHTALSEINYTVQGYHIEILKKDHRGNVVRSLNNVKTFINDPHALAVISGIHSPPLIKNRSFINENKVLTLVPWAAGGPITRYPSSENWVFRLSVDDTKAGDVLVNYALRHKACRAIYLLLEDTPWGDSNLKNMKAALSTQGAKLIGVSRFNWNIKGYTARSKLSDIQNVSADCILLVANAIEGIEIADAMAALNADKRLPIISHWGITGGDFHKKIDVLKRKKLDLSFIQSCFSFMHSPLSGKAKTVLENAKTLFPKNIKSPDDIRSPVGFIHGYDISQLLIAALNKVTLTDDIVENRNNIRLALENLDMPIKGLVKTYRLPYTVFSTDKPDAHEALGARDFCMARYDENNNIIINRQ